MLKCWQYNPQERFDFKEIVENLDKLLLIASNKVCADDSFHSFK